jgi:2-polyprenyl-3-methyl-5-hydroxy-6-metoxy-1,4-benzoquinol methylase
MNLAELNKYIGFCFDHKNINIIYQNFDVSSTNLLINYKFKSISKYDTNKIYSINDIILVTSEDKNILDDSYLYRNNFKIIAIGEESLFNKYFKKHNLQSLYQSSLLTKVFNIGITVAQRKLNKKEREKLWNEYYGYHLEKLYDDKKLDLIFYSGHKYISKINKKGLEVVDFGCGSGYHAEFEKMSDINNYYFIDSNKATVEYLKNKKGYKNVIQSEGSDFKLKDESIDYFICSHILEHIPNLGEILVNIHRKLKPRGSIILVAPCDPGFLWNLLTKFSPNRNRLKRLGLDYDEIMKSEHVNSITKVLDLLRKNFKEKNTKLFPFNFLKIPELNIMYFAVFQKQ